MSIKPEYVDSILSGRKCYEFRRVIFSTSVHTVVIYATKPIGRVVGEFGIEDVISDYVWNLWTTTKELSGMNEQTFFWYFQGRSVGYAIKIGKIKKYRSPFCPKETYGISPPQSFAYLSK